MSPAPLWAFSRTDCEAKTVVSSADGAATALASVGRNRNLDFSGSSMIRCDGRALLPAAPFDLISFRRGCMLWRTYALLFVAIVAEVVATTALARSEGLTRLLPSVVVVIGYGVAFWCLSITLRVMPTGVVLITGVAWIWSKQSLDPPAIVGLALILAGVIVVNLFSSAVGH